MVFLPLNWCSCHNLICALVSTTGTVEIGGCLSVVIGAEALGDG